MRKFQKLILKFLTGNAGITLTAASKVIFAELDWNPATLDQAEARAHRIGQTEEVNVYYLLAPSTADDIIWGILENKEKTLKEIGFSKEEKKITSAQGQGCSTSAEEEMDEVVA